MILRGWLPAAVLLLCAGPLTAQQDAPQADKPDQAQQADLRALVTAVDQVVAGQPASGTLPLRWAQHHFIKSQENRTYVPFTVTIEPAAFTTATPVSVYLRVVSSGQAPPAAAPDQKPAKEGEKPAERPQYPFEDVFFIDLPAPGTGEPNVIRRAFAVPPGDYDVYVAVKERSAAPAPAGAAGGQEGGQQPEGQQAAAAARMGIVKQQVSVPTLEGGEGLQTSSVIVAETAEVLQQPLSTDRQAEHPYTFGQMRLVPSLNNTFSKQDELSVIFWIYNAGLDPSTKKPNLQIDYEFHQKLPEGEKYFNKTEPQLLNAETLPPQFDLAAGHQLPGSLAVPLASFPEGDYRLAIKIQDKIANTTETRDVSFTVAAPAQ